MSRIDYAKAFPSIGVRRKKESRTPKRPGTAAGNPRAISHERLAGQERRRRPSAHTGAGGGDGLASKGEVHAWYRGRQCIATAPLRGRRSHAGGRIGGPRGDALKSPRCARAQTPPPGPSWTYTNVRAWTPLLRRTGDSAELVRTVPMRRGGRPASAGIRPKLRGSSEEEPFHCPGETITRPVITQMPQMPRVGGRKTARLIQFA
jgi:hypothetical protein